MFNSHISEEVLPKGTEELVTIYSADAEVTHKIHANFQGIT